ncbi:hypothetical protein NE237_029412 [Protea cynaroides]|uniref:Myb-like domain-containing protein n=1 Tax=Protea cynaroides TaxID=273540 RepID=A0A9Q0JW22_9MAGN|nr:hypothetical protein NE237_029412 [Protea cynaroides]
MSGVSNSSRNSCGAVAAGNHEGDAGVGGSIPVAGDSATVGELVGVVEEEKLRGKEGDRNLTGNRWPRQETLALLKIRFDMEVAFCDSTLKTPLWGEVSRKLAELGYHRNPKKCKEKFENVYKYYKRTKEGRAARASGKTYHFFNQLEALNHHHPSVAPPPPPPNASTPIASITIDPISTLSSSSEEESGGSRSRKRIRKKLTAFYEKRMNEVREKQEMIQKQFLETVEKREREWVAREEMWEVQKMAKMNRKHELVLQERSIAAALISLLKKISEQASPVKSTELQLKFHENQNQQNPKPNPSQQQPLPLNQAQPSSEKMMVDLPLPATDNAGDSVAATTNSLPSSEKMMVEIPRRAKENAGDSFAVTTNSLSSRWPKSEVQALIRLRTSMDLKYQENGPKGPLWEEISASMKKFGYDRSAKRCKEKWENINKYFKKVKETNRKRPEDAKTCPYYHQLEALYKERSQMQQKMDSNGSSSSNTGLVVGPYSLKPVNMIMPISWKEPVSSQSDLESEDNIEMEDEGGD